MTKSKSSLGGLQRLAEVDGLRAFACLMVLTYHTWQFADLPALGRWVEPLTAGVDLFIVLSGFCLFLPILKNPDAFSMVAFWRQRVRRLVPAYYASMIYVVALPEALVIFWRIIGNPASWQPIPGFGQWITHLSFTHTMFPWAVTGINAPYWSLGLEAQLYLTMPVLVLAYRRFGIRGLFFPLSMSIAWNILLYALYGVDYSFDSFQSLLGISFVGRWLEFIAGAGAAWIVVSTTTGQVILSRAAREFTVSAGLILLAFDLLALRGHAMPVVDLLVLALAVGSLLVGISSMPHEAPLLLTRVLRCRPARFAGMISYSFYLIHQPTEWFFSQFLKEFGVHGFTLWVLDLTAGAALTMLLAYAGFRLFEKPFLRARYVPGVSSEREPYPEIAESTITAIVGTAGRIDLRHGSGDVVPQRLKAPASSRPPVPPVRR